MRRLTSLGTLLALVLSVGAAYSLRRPSSAMCAWRSAAPLAVFAEERLFRRRSRFLRRYRAANGDTSQALEALSWLGARGVCGQSTRSRAGVRRRCLRSLRRCVEGSRARPRPEPRAGAGRGDRSAGAGARRTGPPLRRRSIFFGASSTRIATRPLHMRIQKNINLLSLEGQPAPALRG